MTADIQTLQTVDTALMLRSCGLSVMPVKTNGKKEPSLATWKEFQSEIATETTIRKWYRQRLGVGIIGGGVSGGLEVLDLETPEIAQQWRNLVKEAGGKEVLDRLLVVKTPRGFHCYYRCDSPGHNQDLARRPATPDELKAKPDRKYYKLIETRGEGGYVVAPGSPAECHPDKKFYELVRGDFNDIPAITMEERELLLECARSLNLYHKEPKEYAEPTVTASGGSNSDRPGDLFNERASWAEVLEPHGWQQSSPGRWIRPGGNRDSAMEILDGKRLWVFSGSVKDLPFEHAVSKYAVYAFLNCGGDFTAASKQLALSGYCPEPKAESKPPAEDTDEEEIKIREWPTLAAEALYGLAGRFVNAATESSEADPAAVLAAFLVRAGASFGAHSCLKVTDDRHYPRLFGMVVGASSRARKGTSLGPVRRVFEAAEARIGLSLSALCVANGLSTGEGVVGAVRNSREKQGEEEADAGVADKRLFVEEGEFGGAFKAMQRQGNTLSPMLRKAWDQEDLKTMTKNNPLTATGAHICILGQITKRELGHLMEKVDLSNGLANRFLWFCARRSKILCFPQGLADDVVPVLASELAAAIKFAQTDRIVNLDSAAVKLWFQLYPEITKEVGGIVGEVTSRGEAYVLRLALIYSLLDRDEMIREQHIQAGLAVWEYCLASAKYIFGTAAETGSGDSLNMRVLEALRVSPKTQNQLLRLFRNTAKAKQLAAALSELQSIGRVTQSKGQSSGGRTPIIWSLLGEGGNDVTN